MGKYFPATARHAKAQEFQELRNDDNDGVHG